ncbi:MAG TPA: hypothetical protein VF719_12160 [Abditibacteriaceae bacterium]
MTTSRLLFAIICALLAGVVAVAAGMEIARFRRGGGLVSQRQFRFRMVSAAIWLVILMANFYAVTALWPTPVLDAAGTLTPASKAQARHFLIVIGGAFSLIFVALFLFAYDWWQLSRERLLHEARSQAEFARLAREELQRVETAREKTETKQVDKV